MQRQPHARLLAGVAAALVALASCNPLFGIEGGSPSTGGGAATIPTDGGPGGEGGPDGSGFPATPVLDDFNRADGMLGPNWSVDTPGGFQLSGDQLLANTGTPGIMVWSTVFGATQEVFVTVDAFDQGDGEIELILKNQGMIMECDSIEVDYQPSGMGPGVGMLGIYACADGTPGTYGTAPFTLAPGDQFGARARADGKVEVYKNGKMVNTFDVSPFTYATSKGRIGYFSSSLVAPARLDDFGGGTTP